MINASKFVNKHKTDNLKVQLLKKKISPFQLSQKINIRQKYLRRIKNTVN